MGGLNTAETTNIFYCSWKGHGAISMVCGGGCVSAFRGAAYSCLINFVQNTRAIYGLSPWDVRLESSLVLGLTSCRQC